MRLFAQVVIAVMVGGLPTTGYGAPIEWGEVPHPRGVALLVHGLNNSPEAMRPLGAVLRSLGFATAIVTLDGHAGAADRPATDSERWVENLRQAGREASHRYPGAPLLGLGFSLGGAVCVRALNEGGVAFRRMVLIAPAIELKGYTGALRFVTWLRVFGVAVPSFIPESYRSAATTPLQHYAFLFKTVDALRTAAPAPATTEVQALVVLNEADEFVSSYRTRRFAREGGLSGWRFLALPEAATDLPAHLMVDEPSFGEANWGRFLGALTDFLTDF